MRDSEPEGPQLVERWWFFAALWASPLLETLEGIFDASERHGLYWVTAAIAVVWPVVWFVGRSVNERRRGSESGRG